MELEPEFESEPQLESETELQPESESKLESETNVESEIEPESESGSGSRSGSGSESEPESKLESELTSHLSRILLLVVSMDQGCALRLLVQQITFLITSMDPESELRSLITQTYYLLMRSMISDWEESESELIALITQIISLVSSMGSDSEIRSLITQIASVVSSIDPESELRTVITQIASLVYSMDLKSKTRSLVTQIISLVSSMDLDPEPELNIEPELTLESDQQFISLCPQLEIEFVEGRYRVKAKVQRSNNEKRCEWNYKKWEIFRFSNGEEITHFLCRNCKGEDHEEYEKVPLEVKHPLHPKHSLQLVLLKDEEKARTCYCCENYVRRIFYYCMACDYAMHIVCVGRPAVLAIKHPKRHEHKLYLFPRQTSLTCNICALADLSCLIYICAPCDFVVHRSCISLPRVIRISQHLHRISFTPSFDQRDLSCGVCRRKIDNDYGGYSCIKIGCSYAAHSRCATQSNVWDGKELEGEPEEIEEEEVEPFVRIRDGVIQHFCHKHHHLKLDENASQDYDENKLCEACIVPIYYGSFYSCMQCEFILHEACANLSRKIHHPIHPHLLTLCGGYDGVIKTVSSSCSACPWFCTGFFYNCGNERCYFKLHVQCATISEPLVHESHIHPLYLTSIPGQRRTCHICKDPTHNYMETFNCIECDFSLCFKCATLPHKVRYKHAKHMLTLSYGEETSTTTYWCEACQRRINPKERFYMCDDYCCVTLHISCLNGGDFYTKPGSSLSYFDRKIDILSNKHMSRPICRTCGKHCQYKVVFQCFGSIFCSTVCVYAAICLSIE